jgi:hypothetical protein
LFSSSLLIEYLLLICLVRTSKAIDDLSNGVRLS